MSGGAEITQEKGREGLLRAKDWLEATTRIQVPWLVHEAPTKVRITRPDGSIHRFDFAGYWNPGSDWAPKSILGECKNYDNASDQGSHYVRFLADCYFDTLAEPEAGNHYMWVTWAPFAVTIWDTLCTREKVKSSVEASNHAVDEDGDRLQVDLDLAKQVADSLWILVLSSKQVDHLTLSPDMQALVRGNELVRRSRG